MKTYPRAVLLICVILVAAPLHISQAQGPSKATVKKSHVISTADKVKWMPAAALPTGAQIAVLSGDPAKDGLYTLWVKLPDGLRVAPHWHPRDEHVAVLKGTFLVGIGEKFDRASAHALSAGNFMLMPQEVRHYAWSQGETIIQVHGIGPFVVNYVNPADDPRKPMSRP